MEFRENILKIYFENERIPWEGLSIRIFGLSHSLISIFILSFSLSFMGEEIFYFLKFVSRLRGLTVLLFQILKN